VTEQEIEDFLRVVNTHLPAANLARDGVRQTYAGLRPLIDDHHRNTYRASRRAEIIDHRRQDRLEGLLSVIGGKWTTARRLAQTAVDAALRKLGRSRFDCATADRKLPGGKIGRFSTFVNEARIPGVSVPNLEHLARLYGSRLSRLFATLRDRPELAAPLSASGDIGAQILLAVREEMALTLEDTVIRRTGIGQEGDPGTDALLASAAIMAAECGWSQTRKRAEIDAVAAKFRRGGTKP